MKQVVHYLYANVVEAIEEEFKHQNRLSAIARADEKDHGVSGQLVVLERYVRKALDAWADNAGEEAALHEVRKCAAIALRTLQLYGCPRRKFGEAE